jgi:hypothetical protein
MAIKKGQAAEFDGVLVPDSIYREQSEELFSCDLYKKAMNDLTECSKPNNDDYWLFFVSGLFFGFLGGKL